ncbi:rhodanese-like domain-containing protein [Pelagimonas sp. KU-00592-HH]|uniref:rhodanese-like domain-containing protein n=1 Tax=Pelagimonas sp. KU-00592-HH TaxID=3127651 RepID=UPI0031088C01
MAITPVKTLVEEAKKEITTLDQDKAQAMVDAGEAMFVDIRDIRELEREGRMPGAVHGPRGMLEFWIDPESPYHKPVFDTDKTLILFCAGAWRSALAVKALQDIGVENIAEMEGGFGSWKKQGRSVE